MDSEDISDQSSISSDSSLKTKKLTKIKPD